MKVPKDILGRELMVGQTVARGGGAISGGVHLCKVTKVDSTGAYLDNSKTPLKYPNRVAIVLFQ